jgi:ADP-ribosylglycohydrolase
MYSDDTQLRLAVCRCLRSDGRFDIEAFSKIELPTFPSYELGAGVGTKAAAHALGKKATRWNSNFFTSKRSRYITGGGNGAAMRIQPHVWASRSARPAAYLPAVLSDTVCTHGHPRAILGAALHALALGAAIGERSVPDPSRWEGMATFLEGVPKIMEGEEDLAERWLPIWEREVGQSFEKSSAETIKEIREQLKIAAKVAKKSQKEEQEAYAELTEKLGGLSPKTRGSGTITAVLSLWLAWRCEDRAAEGCRLAANLIGSDTDTIATMAGALAGPLQESPPPGPICDAALHIREAVRAEAIGADQRVEDFPHPDPLRFKAPSTLTGFFGVLDGQTVLAGLGPVNLEGEMMVSKGHDQEGWQWVQTEFGQHMWVKRRRSLPELGRWAAPRHRQLASRKSEGSPSPKVLLGENGAEGSRADVIEDAVQQLAEGKFQAALFDQLFRGLALGPNGAARAGVFGALVAERLRDRELPDER